MQTSKTVQLAESRRPNWVGALAYTLIICIGFPLILIWMTLPTPLFSSDEAQAMLLEKAFDRSAIRQLSQYEAFHSFLAAHYREIIAYRDSRNYDVVWRNSGWDTLGTRQDKVYGFGHDYPYPYKNPINAFPESLRPEVSRLYEAIANAEMRWWVRRDGSIRITIKTSKPESGVYLAHELYWHQSSNTTSVESRRQSVVEDASRDTLLANGVVYRINLEDTNFGW